MGAKTYSVLQRIEVDGQTIQAGSTVELTDLQAEELLKREAVALVAAPARAAAPVRKTDAS